MKKNMFKGLKQAFCKFYTPSGVGSRQAKIKRLGLLMACLFVLFVGFQNCNKGNKTHVGPPGTRCPAGENADGTCRQDSTGGPRLTISTESETTDSITWSWTCPDLESGDACTYAHIIKASSSEHAFQDSDFDDTTTATKAYDSVECADPPCSYWLHVQAKRSSDDEKSAISMKEKDLGPDNSGTPPQVTVTPESSDTSVESVAWTWDCDQSCTFRHAINTQAEYQFSATHPYGEEKTKTQNGVGTFYLHVQAQNSSGVESQVKSVKAVLASTSSQLELIAVPDSSDTSVASVTWAWECNQPTCTFRHTISQNATHTFTDSDAYGETKTATQTGDGTFYLHIQAKKGTSESQVKSVKAVLAPSQSSLAVTVTPGGSDTPVESVTWTWDCNQSPCQFRYIINQNATHTFTDSDAYGETKTANHTGDGTFYLHVQAKKDTSESQVESIKAVLEPSDKAQVANGIFHSCYLKSGGVKCWGNNSKGQLGLAGGNASPKDVVGDQANEMGNLSTINLGGRAISIDASKGAHWSNCPNLCEPDTDNDETYESKCLDVCGSNRTACRTQCTSLATDAAKNNHCRQRCGQDNMNRQGRFSCALLEGGDVKCWGENTYGQLGQGHNRNIGDGANEMDNLPSIDLGHKAIAISVGGHHACALLDNECIKCWGANNVGQLGYNNTDHIGDGDEMGTSLPPVGGNNFKVKSIAAGFDFTCAIMKDDKVKCWGRGTQGQLGQGSTDHIGDDDNEIDNLNAITLGRSAKAISAGTYHACAILADNSVKCWGHNNAGQLGQGHRGNIGTDSGDMSNLSEISLGTDDSEAKLTARTIATGVRHTCALLSDQSMRCWGLNHSGQLGIGDITGQNSHIGDVSGEMGNALTAVAVETDRTVASIFAGGHNSCFVLDNDDVKCWGHNWAGQLGQGDVTTTQTNNDRGDNEAITSVDPIPLSMMGVCGTERNTCFVGEPDDEAVDDSTSHYKWSCSGVNGGNADESCTLAIPSS